MMKIDLFFLNKITGRLIKLYLKLFTLDLKQETYEIDRRVSVCFKDVAPFSMLLKQDANVCRNIHDLLIVVHTDPSNFQLRAEFRKTLRKIKREATINNLQIDSVFMLGLDENLCVSRYIIFIY